MAACGESRTKGEKDFVAFLKSNNINIEPNYAISGVKTYCKFFKSGGTNEEMAASLKEQYDAGDPLWGAGLMAAAQIIREGVMRICPEWMSVFD